MNAFPLAPFLLALGSDGIRPTLHDYQRLSLVLQTPGPWTITRLRDVLLALLVKDAEQEEIFRRRFDEFFKLPPERAAAFANVDLERGLAELRQLPAPQPDFPTMLSRQAQPPRPPAPPGKTWQRWILLGGGLLLVLLIALYAIWPKKPAVPIVTLSHTTLGFSAQSLKTTSADSIIILTNSGGAPLIIDSVTISGQDAKNFAHHTDLTAGGTLAPGENSAIRINFTTDSARYHIASLDIHHHAADNLNTVLLLGRGLVPPTPQRDTRRQRLYPHVPHIELVNSTPAASSENWQGPAIIAGILFGTLLLYGIFLWRSRKIPADKAPPWDPNGPRHFPLGKIGGPPPRLDGATLDQLADAMGYFQSEQASRALDVPASIAATGRNGGIPRLIFQKSKQIRRVLILEDTGAEARTWNPIAAQLAEGLSQRAVPITHGLFRGGPELFVADGVTQRLEDIEDQRHGYLVLIFSDGKGLQSRRDAFALERLSRWPRVAWMEWREPKFWDDSTAIPSRFGLPIFPATAAGLLKATARFLTEQSDREELAAATNWRGVPAYTGQNLNAHLEQILGEALPWAQAGAMIQPLTVGLAEAVRQRFLPNLPAEQIGRLLALPDTRHNVSGLRFAPAVLAILRAGFASRWEEKKQEDVLRFLLEKINAAEPEATDSPAHLAWEMKREQVRLELDPEAALQRLAELAGTPAGATLRAELEKTVLPGETRAGGIPLRRKPKDKNALQRLARLAENSGVKKLEAYPIALGHRLALGFLFLSFIAFSFLALSSFRRVDQLFNLNVLLSLPDSTKVLAKLEAATGPNEWQTISAEPAASLTSTQWKNLPSSFANTYRVVTFSEGIATDTTIGLSNGAFRFRTRLQPELRPCTENFPDFGLSVDRCYYAAGLDRVISAGWRATVQRSDSTITDNWLSIGLEIITDGQVPSDVVDDLLLTAFREDLLKTNSVDAIYRIAPASDGKLHLAEAIKHIKTENAPWLDKTQLVYWAIGVGSDTLDLSHLTISIRSSLKLGSGVLNSWLSPLQKARSQNKSALLTENEILSVLGRGEAEKLPPVVLLASTPMPDSLRTGLAQGQQADSLARAVPSRIFYMPPDTAAMMLIPGGTFMMGSNDGENDEKPVHRVQVDSFYMDLHEVTIAQFKKFVEATKHITDAEKKGSSYIWTGSALEDRKGINWRYDSKGDSITAERMNLPVVHVSWNDATAYAGWAGRRLPTEAEWEYAARDGSRQMNWAGTNEQKELDQFAWFSENSGNQAHPVGKKRANFFGLFDLSGNVWEWCSDWYDENYYAVYQKQGIVKNPTGPRTGSQRVLRGGSWVSNPSYLRCAGRNWGNPTNRNNDVGFRCVQDVR